MKNLISLFFAFIFSLIIIPAGVVFHLILSVKSVVTLKWWSGTKKFFNYWIMLIWQLYIVVSYLAYHLAVSLDMIWNVIAGDLVKKTSKDNSNFSLFGAGDTRLSESIGDMVYSNNHSSFLAKFWVKIMDIIWLSTGSCRRAINKMFTRKNSEI